MEKPKVQSPELKKEIDKLDTSLNAMHTEAKQDNDVSFIQTHNYDLEEQTKKSSRELSKENIIHLTPSKWLADGQKFNEAFRKDWEFAKMRVNFIAEHREMKGERVELWTHEFGGVGAEFWRVPVNCVVNGPRYLAEQMHKNGYKSKVMDEHALKDRLTSENYNEDHVPFGKDVFKKRINAQPYVARTTISMFE